MELQLARAADKAARREASLAAAAAPAPAGGRAGAKQRRGAARAAAGCRVELGAKRLANTVELSWAYQTYGPGKRAVRRRCGGGGGGGGGGRASARVPAARKGAAGAKAPHPTPRPQVDLPQYRLDWLREAHRRLQAARGAALARPLPSAFVTFRCPPPPRARPARPCGAPPPHQHAPSPHHARTPPCAATAGPPSSPPRPCTRTTS